LCWSARRGEDRKTKIEIRKAKRKTGKWKPENGNSKTENRKPKNRKLEKFVILSEAENLCGCMVGEQPPKFFAALKMPCHSE
jgi:hypothetical protein